MSEPTERPAPRLPLCASIRTKGMFLFTEEAPPPVETDTAVWWCVRTMTTVGPDGDAVHQQFCDGSRACYTPSGPSA